MGGPLKHSERNIWVGPSQHFDAVDRLPARLLRDLWLTPVPPPSAHTVTCFYYFFLSWRPYGALLHFRGVLASSSSLGGMRGHFITSYKRWHTSVKMPCQVVFWGKLISMIQKTQLRCNQCHVSDDWVNLTTCQNGDHARNSTEAPSMTAAAVWERSEAKQQSTLVHLERLHACCHANVAC